MYKRQEILEAQNCLSLKDLAVTGRDLIDAGVKPGPTLGVILNAMLEAVIEHPEYNTKEYQMCIRDRSGTDSSAGSAGGGTGGICVKSEGCGSLK